MLKIKVNDKFLELGKTSISFELLSPIFNDIGSFSYPFTFPTSSKNRRILEFPDRINYGKPTKKIHNAEIYINGLLWKRGSLSIKEAGELQIKANFAVGEGSYFSKINDIKINELPFNIYFVGEPDRFLFYDIWHNKYPDVDFALFYHRNTHFTDGLSVPPHLENNLQYFTEFNRFHEIYYYFLPFNPILPFVYVNKVIDKINSQANIYESYNELKKNEELKQLVFFNNKAASQLDTYENNFITGNFWPNNFLPKIKAGDFFKELEKNFGLYIFFDEYKNAVTYQTFQKILEKPPTDIDAPYKLKSIIPADFSDGFTTEVDDKIIEEKNVVNKKIMEFNYRGSVNSLDNLPVTAKLNDMYFVDNQGKFYYLSSEYGAWLVATDFAYPVFRMPAGKRIAKHTASLLHTEAAIKGNVSYYGSGSGENKEIPCGFLFYRGLVKSKSGSLGNYFFVQPLGTAYEQHPDFEGKYNYSMRWAGSAGLYENFWKRPTSFYNNTRQADFLIQLSPAQLKNLDFSKPYRFADANWLIDKINFTLRNDGGISTATVKAWKIQ